MKITQAALSKVCLFFTHVLMIIPLSVASREKIYSEIVEF